jgi:Amt family ammonium transporter
MRGTCAAGTIGLIASALAAGAAFGQEGPTIDTGDTAWMLTSTALVLMMTIPGLALFYGGQVRRKNVIATVTKSFVITCVVTVLWIVVGYSAVFEDGGALQSYIGGFNKVMLAGVGIDTQNGLAPTIPEYVFVTFQMTFAIITPALAVGSFAERVKFSGIVIFTIAWLLLVYVPIAHWVWGGGFLGSAGALDFAGGTVVHINAGIAGLAGALVLGKRTDAGPPHNLVYSLIGAALLWVGWFGFNAGSAAGASTLAGAAFINTQVATAVAALAWMIVEIFVKRKPTLLGLVSGAVAGLVAITPAAGFVNPSGAIIIGAAGGVAAFVFVVIVKNIFKYDDTLDVFGVHGIAGIVGALLTGVLADAAINSLGEGANIGAQAYAVGVTLVYGFVVSFAILFVLRLLGLLRASKEQESEGLDIALHGETVQ